MGGTGETLCGRFASFSFVYYEGLDSLPWRIVPGFYSLVGCLESGYLDF
jgi:hypothetical protein